MIGGNHEDRYEKFRINVACNPTMKKLRGLTSWFEEYQLERRGWTWIEYGKWIQIGKLIFTHGWYAGGGAAKQMGEKFPGRNVIFGHTHRHLIHGCTDERDLPIESESIGTLSKFDLSYLKGKPPVEWIHGFMYIDMHWNGTFTKHFVRVISGRFVEYGKYFC